jgi:small subunit ribosomal protein S20
VTKACQSELSGRQGSATIARPAERAFFVMPNIQQQKKRVRTAARERLENLRYRSSIKTLTKRLQTAVADGDEERAAAEYRELVRAIDKATSRRALHRNTAARKKAQASRLLSGS